MRRRAAVLMSAVLLWAACAVPLRAGAAQATWAPFWTKFKTAVVKGDRAAVLRLSDSAELPAAYTALFGTRSKKRCFARAKPVVDEQGGYSVFCGEQGYYFKQVNGQFRFTESFAND